MTDEVVTLTLHIRKEVYERIWTAAARNGMSRTAVVNEYVELFDSIATSPSGTRMKVRLLRDGTELWVDVVRNDIAGGRRRRWQWFRRS